MGVVSLELCQHFPELDSDLENNGSRKAVQNRSTKLKKRYWRYTVINLVFLWTTCYNV